MALSFVAILALLTAAPFVSAADERHFAAASIAELRAALAQAAPGDVVELAAGEYGPLELSGFGFDGEVAIRSADPERPAEFASIEIANCRNIRIEGVHVNNPTDGDASSKLVKIANSYGVAIVGSEINATVDGTEDYEDYIGHFGVYVRDSERIEIAGNTVHDVRDGVTVIAAKDIRVVGNDFDYLGHDTIKIVAVDGVLIENNMGARHIFSAPSAHKDFIQFGGGDSSNIVIRGNVYLAGTEVWVQGIFMDDAVFNHVLIEDNIIYTGILRGISVTAGTDVTIRNNTVLNLPNDGHKATVIVAPEGATVADNIMGAKKSRLAGDNIVLGMDNCRGALCYRTTYRNAGVGLGATIEDLEPIPGGPADPKGGKGAWRRYGELASRSR